VRFSIVAHAALVQRRFQLTVMLVCGQVGNGLSKVRQEPVAGLGVLDHSAGKYRHPGKGSYPRRRLNWAIMLSVLFSESASQLSLTT
jgi:hypothetical protein